MDDKVVHTDQEPAAQEDAAVCVFKKPSRGNTKNMRKRSSEADEEQNNREKGPDSAESEVVRKAKQPSHSRGIMVSSNKVVKLDTHSYESSNTVGSSDQNATAINEMDSPTAAAPKATVSNADGVYRGMSGYTDFIEKKESMQPKGLRGIKAGPVKAAANVRMTSRFDYQPDLCKDYKETGYCGFGLACKFMHDRGDYKSGWQLEKEWDDKEKARRESRASGKGDADKKENYEVEDGEDDEIPFACFICRKPFTNPVVTRCKHYYCESCALSHHRKSNKCFICNEPTNGIFNIPKKLVEKLKQAKPPTEEDTEG